MHVNVIKQFLPGVGAGQEVAELVSMLDDVYYLPTLKVVVQSTVYLIVLRLLRPDTDEDYRVLHVMAEYV